MSNNKLLNSGASIEALLAATQREIESVRRTETFHDDTMKSARGNKNAIQKELTDLERASSGFGNPRFEALARIGAAYAAAFNGKPQEEAARLAAEKFVEAFTNATAKTQAGGTASGYAVVISLGTAAEKVRATLDSRVKHWQRILDESPEAEGAEAKAERIAEARRYTEVPNCGNKDKPGKHNGRPMREFSFKGSKKLLIPAGLGSDRKAQLAAFARLYRDNGDVALLPEVVDAFLDNGGRRVAGETAQTLSKQALNILAKLRVMAPESPDMAAFALVEQVLTRVSNFVPDENSVGNGFIPAKVAPATPAAPRAAHAVSVEDAEEPTQDEIDRIANDLLAAEVPKGGRKQGSVAL